MYNSHLGLTLLFSMDNAMRTIHQVANVAQIARNHLGEIHSHCYKKKIVDV